MICFRYSYLERSSSQRGWEKSFLARVSSRGTGPETGKFRVFEKQEEASRTEITKGGLEK